MKTKTVATNDNSFLTTLQRHRGGLLLDELSEKLREVVANVNAVGKAGTVTLVMTVKPAHRGQSAVVITDKVGGKVPSLEAEASFWFATDDGDLVKDDPRQKTFNLTVQGGATDTSPAPVARAAAV